LLYNLLDFRIECLEKVEANEELVPFSVIFNVNNGLASSNVEVKDIQENL
jgi:hypothetical protein